MLIHMFLFIQELESASFRFVVAAIEVGNCYSGYALSFKHDWLRTHHKQWISGQGCSYKVPTSMLFNADKSFRAFGYNAESAFDDMENKSDVYYFRRLKDVLSIKVSCVFSIMFFYTGLGLLDYVCH